MAFVVGLDLGTRTIKGAVFLGTSRSYRLVDFFVEDIPLLQDTEVALGGGNGGEEIEAILSPEEILHRVLEARKLTRADIYAALDAKDCGIRDIPFPYTREDQIQKTVGFEAENYFHAFDLNDVTLEWVKVGESEGVSHLVLIAARNSEIEERLGLLKRAEVDPIALDLDSAALANAFALSSYYDETKNTLLLDMGATSTKIVLLEEGKLKKVRSLRTGSTVLDPGRMIPEPLAVDAAGQLYGGDEELAGRAVDLALESRFDEFENALRDLQPGAGNLFETGAGDLGVEESRNDAPIAILTDEEYDRIEKVETDGASSAPEDPEATTEVAEPVPGEADSAESEAPESEPAEARTETDLAGDNEATRESDETVDYQTYLDRVGVEIQRTLATTQLDAPIELICLTGGMSRREEARRYFQDAFDIETVRLDFRDSLETDLDAGQLDLVASEGAVAVGLAAKGLGKDLVGLDFRKGPYRFEHRLERMRVPLLVCAILCFFVFLQSAFWSFHRYRTLRDHAVAYEHEAGQVYKTFFDKEPVKGRNPVASALDQKKRWEAGGLSDVGRFLPYVEVVRDVSRVLASTGLFYRLNGMKFEFGLSKKASGQGRKKRTVWRAADSQVVLEVKESDGYLTIENAFDRAPKSQFFDAETQSSPQAQGDYKVTVKLKVTETVLSAPASGSGPVQN